MSAASIKNIYVEMLFGETYLTYQEQMLSVFHKKDLLLCR